MQFKTYIFNATQHQLLNDLNYSYVNIHWDLIVFTLNPTIERQGILPPFPTAKHSLRKITKTNKKGYRGEI